MIKTKEDLKLYLNEDARRNGINPDKYFNYIIRLLCGSESANIVHWLRHFRKWEYYHNSYMQRGGVFNRLLTIYHKIRTNRIGIKLKIRMPINTIGYGIKLIHISPCGITMTPRKVGNYCGFNAGVQIGRKGGLHDCPTIGDYVAFGPGAKAFGDIIIGDNVFVAANSVVTKDCEPHCIYGGIPAKKIKEKNSKIPIVHKC